jgi:hypothetical protein
MLLRLYAVRLVRNWKPSWANVRHRFGRQENVEGLEAAEVDY